MPNLGALAIHAADGKDAAAEMSSDWGAANRLVTFE